MGGRRSTSWRRGERPPGGDRTGSRQSEDSRRRIAASVRARAEAKRQAADHVQREDVRRRLFNEAERAVVLDAIELLRQNEPLAAKRIVKVIRTGRDGDALSAARELLNRTRGLPVQEVRQLNVNAELDDQAASALLERMLARRLESRVPGTQPGGHRLQHSENKPDCDGGDTE